MGGKRMDLTSSSETGVDLSGRRLIAALFRETEHARAAVDDLKQNGFSDHDIGFVYRDDEGSADTSSVVGESAATGAVGGGIVGGILGAVLGATALAIPGFGPVVAAGIFTAAATGAGIGAVGGGLLGTLVGMGFSKAEAERLHEGIAAGYTLVSVNALGRTEQAREILARHGGDLGPAALEDVVPLDEAEGRAELL
ncbi:MAG TPA: hypothetical protein VGE01_03155 [Fimbriimonas sp.]